MAALAVSGFMGAGLVFQPGLLGLEGGEVYGHAWVQWWHGQALPGWPRGTSLAVGTEDWPVIDPLPTLLAAGIGRLLGVVAGYNAWLLGSVALAFAGGATLARRVNGNPWVGGVALALAPSLVGSLASGLTEDGALGLAALGLALVTERSLARVLLAGVCLGLLAWCGLVLAWYTALAATCLGLWTILRIEVARSERWNRLVGLILAGALAVLIASPVAGLQGGRLVGEAHEVGQLAVQAEPLWRLNPWRGADLASLLTPGRQDVGDALIRVHPGYLGGSLLLLSLAAGRSPFWGVLALGVALAPGTSLSWAGEPLGLSNPAVELAHALPLGDRLHHHGRALLLAAVALSALSARGARRLMDSRRLVLRLAGRVAPIAVALDLALLSPLKTPLPVAGVSPLDVVAMLEELPDGPLLLVPVAGPGVHPQRPLLDQRVHGRALVLAPNRPGLPSALSSHPVGRWLAGLSLPRPSPPPASIEPLPGVAVLVVTTPYVEQVTAVVGPPDLVGQDGAAWSVARWGTVGL
ncbi:MAG: hypothetical protein QGG40_13685 [Myxococcota bacterium]|nr:hypothetical protein [Myxococcota bacterium]